MSNSKDKLISRLQVDEPNYASLAEQFGAEALPHLAELVESGDEDLASKAISLAGFISAPESHEVIALGARSGNPVLRSSAAGAMTKLRGPALERLPAELLTSLLDDEDAGVRKWALRAVETYHPPYVIEKVGELAEKEPHPELRRGAATLLGEFRDKE